MLGFAPLSDLSVSDPGGESFIEIAFDAAVELTATATSDDPWQCQSGAATTWTCQ